MLCRCIMSSYPPERSTMLRDREIEGPSGREDGWASSARPGGLGQGLHALTVSTPIESMKLPTATVRGLVLSRRSVSDRLRHRTWLSGSGLNAAYSRQPAL